MVEFLIGKYSGFCFGVKRAVEEADKLNGENDYVLGEIIHNEEVIERLKNKGIVTVNSLEEVPLGATLMIRTHGESKQVFEDAQKKNLNVVDCTCPFVKEIQNIVSAHYLDGYKIVIIGDESHPEVKGINGWCENTALITSDTLDLSVFNGEKVCIVVQTTFSMKKFEEILKNIRKDCVKTVEIFKTICYTTIKRQTEADIISKKCDSVIVLGGKNSNNTNKLFDICKKNCGSVFRAVSPKELDYKEISKFRKVGIVLGASTPDSQSQEVIHAMENVTEVKTSNNEEVVQEVVETANEKVEANKAEPATMADAVAMMDTKSKKFRKGQIITATISKVENDGLAVYIPNTKKEVLLLAKELINEISCYESKIGDEIEVMITGLNPVVLSEKAIVKIKEEEAEIAEIKNGKIFNVTVTATNKGGLTGEYGSYQVFIPSSQIRIGFVKDLDKYVGKTLRCKAEKIETSGRKQIVASQRTILEEEKAIRDAEKAQKEAEFFGSIEVGDIVRGTTQRFSDFGAFVQVNGFDCLAHISDLSWTGCKKCSDVLELNTEYEFKILKIDAENKKVSIGYKQLQPKPWDLAVEKYHAGDVIKGKVVRLVSFGAFVEVEKGVDGLVHVSQISHEWLENPTSALKVGEEVEAKILEIDSEKEKMTLSIKILLPEPETVKKPSKAKVEGEEKEEKPARRSKVNKDEVKDDSLREWTDDNGGASIAEILGNIEE